MTDSTPSHDRVPVMEKLALGVGSLAAFFGYAGVSVLAYPVYNMMLGVTMLGGRFLLIVPILALAGNLASKKSVPPSPGPFPVNGSLFTVLLVGVVVIVGALTFFPALSLGPILEHLQLHAGKLY